MVFPKQSINQKNSWKPRLMQLIMIEDKERRQNLFWCGRIFLGAVSISQVTKNSLHIVSEITHWRLKTPPPNAVSVIDMRRHVQFSSRSTRHEPLVKTQWWFVVVWQEIVGVNQFHKESQQLLPLPWRAADCWSRAFNSPSQAVRCQPHC